MRAPPDRAALLALHGAFLTSLQICLCSSVHQGRAQAPAQGGRRSRRFFAVRTTAENRRRRRDTDRRIIFLQWQQACRSMPAALYRAAVLRFDAPRRRSAAPTGRRSAEARTPLQHGVPPPARVLGAHVCSLLRGMHVGMSGRRHVVHAGRVGRCGATLRLARAAPRGPLSPSAFRVACEMLVRAGKFGTCQGSTLASVPTPNSRQLHATLAK